MQRAAGRSAYLVAVASVGVMLALKALIDPPAGPHIPLFVLLIPIVVSAWYGGIKPGLLATALSATATTFFFLPPVYSIYIASGDDFLALTMFVVVGIVISALCELLRAAGRRSERLATIVKSSDDAIIAHGLDGTITEWNDGAARIFGYAADEVLGRSMSMFVPPECAAEWSRILDRLAAGERVDHFETTRMSRAGRLDVSLTVSPVLDDRGGVVGVSSIARDITDRKRAEVAERKAEALRSVASLAAATAHEINNPLTVVTGQVELTLRALPADDAARPRLDAAVQAADRIRAIVARMRSINRVEMSRDFPQLPEMIDLEKSTATTSR